MSNFPPPRPQPSYVARQKFAIVASQYNAEFVQGMVNAAQRTLEEIAPRSELNLYEVPGAFEIPVVLQEVAAQGGCEAIIALGVIIRGETAHADLIGRSITDALQSIAMRFRIPVIHEVLLVDNEAQARERTLGEARNRGAEAAQAALQAAETMHDIREAVAKGEKRA